MEKFCPCIDSSDPSCLAIQSSIICLRGAHLHTNINLTCNIMKCHKCHHAIIYSSMYSTTVVALRYAAHCLYFLYFRPHSPQPYVSSACRLGQTQFPFLMFWPCSNDAVICMPSSWSCLVVFNAHISNSSNNMVELNWQRQSKYCFVNLIT